MAPDRLLMLLGFAALALRDPSLGQRPYLRLTPTHAVLALAAAFALCSAVAAGTIGEVSALSQLFDRFGIVPFLLFAVGPLVFHGERQRRILLGTFLLLGAYLGLTALCQGLKLDALVFPKYILQLNPEIQAGRARGPFIDSAINGLALFYCTVMAAIAAATFSRPWLRGAALAIAALCVVDLLFTQQRSVWIGALAASLCAAIAAPGLRRKLPLAVPLGLAALAGLPSS